ncbi:M48 family metallopeptidase [Rubellimicrobium aerolatum]|uniref:M48 family metallopeptidase n=1 Tax=Rubellimicrobium aerolatum TaxID=490979 RepID=A0ABW0SB36_9RHOB|nr:putative metalloprotease [Rubellimicrobium aerolatum]
MVQFLPLLLMVLAAVAYARAMAWRTARALDQRSAELTDPVLVAAFQRLAEALDLPRIRVRLYDVPMVNGLASADGRVFLTRGFHDRFRAGQVTAEELASVVAHELGHVALGHARRRMIDFTGQNAVRMGLMMVLGRLLPGIGPWAAQMLMSLVAARLSRRDEYEADAYATALLIKAGIGTGPQKSLFRKLGRMAGRGANAPAWLLTHPRTEERIAAIEANERRWLSAPDAPA